MVEVRDRPRVEPRWVGVRLIVVVASAHGSATGVAERIAVRVQASGIDARCRTFADLGSASDCDALVLGSAVHNRQWLPESDRAIEAAGDCLGGLPLWLFSVSSVGATTSVLSDRVAAFIRPRTPEPMTVERLRRTRTVRDHRWFAGAVGPGDWPGFGRVVFRLLGGRYGDARDWADIDRWADRIVWALTAR